MIFFTILQYGLLFWFSYWFIVSLFGFGKAGELRNKAPEKKFVILVPAHNEEAVIGNLVQNLGKMKYPKELYDIVVIADNSDDDTAAIARRHGAIVLEHFSVPGEPKGKPYAIKYALEELPMEKYDAVCVFDADNLVTLNYLQLMNDHLLSGERLIQCYLDSKNPNDNVISLGYAASYYYMNRSWQLAKYRLGLGNAVGGTGFCVERSLLEEVGWTAKSLTEDLEFTVQCLLRGEKATWCHHARVYDEKPTGFLASCIQRLRWARGHWDVCFKYAGPLLWRAVRKLDIRAFDGFLYLINPGKIVIGAIASAIFYTAYFTNVSIVEPILPLWVWLGLVTFNFIYVSATLRDSAHKIDWFRAIISLLFINYTYVPLFMWSMVTSSRRVWVRTEHTKNVNIEDMRL
ncbi:glycosyltransferase family 2 protein [Paenibacillus sp. GCM10023252]|uniref:glycosyltransferase family 2 protein n=1 Tax=Paenibacillus sp. GCM10023252 TaxID=3252649 RepID=UPI0036228486